MNGRGARLRAAVADGWRQVDRALVAPGSAHRLIEVHLLLAVVIGIRLVGRDWTLIAARPQVLTDGLTIMSWLPVTPPATVLVTVQILGILGVLLVVMRRAPRFGFVLAWVAYTVLTALWGSSGKVMHNDVLTVTVAAVMLAAQVPPRLTRGRSAASSHSRVSGEAALFSASDLGVRWGWPPRAALAVIAVIYTITGLQKLRHSGLAWAFGANMAWVLRQGSSPYAQGIADAVAQQPLVYHGLAAGALALELTAIGWLALRRTRIPFVVAAALMHTSIWLFLGLDYSAWVLTVAAVAIPMGLRPDRRLLSLRARRPDVRPEVLRT